MAKSSDEEDQDLMKAIADGEETALRRLMEKHGGPLMRYTGHILDDFHRCEDAVQHVFTQVWMSASSWKPKAKVKTWIYTIAYRHCLNMIRAERPAQDIQDYPIEDQSMQPDAVIQAEQNKQILEETMDTLPERQKTALLLRFAEGFSQKEAAQILDVSEKALESLISRGKAELAKKLNPYKEAM